MKEAGLGKRFFHSHSLSAEERKKEKEHFFSEAKRKCLETCDLRLVAVWCKQVVPATLQLVRTIQNLIKCFCRRGGEY